MKKATVIIVALAALLAWTPAAAQEFSAEVDLTSNLMWRGMQNTPSPTILPTINFDWGGLCVYTTAAYAVDDTYREWDFGLSYSLGDFTLEVIDYFYPACVLDPIPDLPNFDFLNWKNASTGHQLDVMLHYEPESIPVRAMFSIIPFGDDKLDDGSQAFSSYLELGWYHDFENDSRIECNLGASLFESPIYGNEGFALVNTELKYGKTYSFNSFELPLSVSCIFNPIECQPYICAGVGIAF